MSKFSDKAFKEFISEADDMISTFEQGILDLDESVANGELDQDILNEVFRAAHSLKGAAGMFGLDELSKYSHSLENMLDSIRLGKIDYNDDVFNVLYEGSRFIRELLELISKKAPLDQDEISRQIKIIETAIDGNKKNAESNYAKEAGIDESITGVLTEYEEHRLSENIRNGNGIFKVNVSFSLESFDVELEQLTKTIKEFGEVITTLPSSEPAKDMELRFDIIVGATIDLDTFISRINNSEVAIELLGKLEVKKKELTKVPVLTKTKSKFVRADIEKLDYILNIVGELALARVSIDKTADALKSEVKESGLVLELQKTVKMLERKLKELQMGIMEIRMVPLRQIFDNLARVVKKITRDSDKKINLEIFGADTELDKLIVEELADPLMHLIRNSIDHGIETPQERLLAGKKEEGNVTLKAFQKGNHVVIEISDDGKGIDLDKIREKAIEKGLMLEDDELSQEDLVSFIFAPGFSTKDDVSELSGRGVGMDVVKSNIIKLSGMVDVSTEKNKGSTFTITLPITLAIIQALVVNVCDESFAIPLNSILESDIIEKEKIRKVEGKEVLELRNSTIPLIRPSKVFKIDNCVENDELNVIVVGLADKKWGIIVDSIVGQQDVVIKPLGKSLKGIKAIAGATDLGDQRTILVIDVAAFINKAMA